MVSKQEYFDTCVVVPTKDRKEYLLRALKSVDCQETLPRQVVVIDDGSKDKVIDEDFLSLKKISVHIVRNELSKGGAVSRNIGIKESGTEYISFLDDDDAWDGDYLKNIKIASEKYSGKNVAFYGSKKFVFSNDLDKVFKVKLAKKNIGSQSILRENGVGGTSCLTICKSALTKEDCFDERLPALQDFDLWVRLALAGNVFMPVTEAYVKYTINVENKQISANYSNHIKCIEVLKKKYKTLLSNMEYRVFVGTLDYFLAKAIHRRNYSKSLIFTLKSLFLSPRARAFAFFIPYPFLNLLGIYTS